MRVVVLACVIVLLQVCVAFGEIYRWVGQDGTVHFTDNPAAIPPPYRNQTEVRSGDTRPLPPTQQTTPGPAKVERKPQVSRGIVVALQRVGNALFAQATLNGFVRVPLVVDTGAAFTVISTTSAQRLGLNLDQAAILPMQSASGTFLAHLTKVRSLTVGAATVHDVEVIVHDTSPGQDTGLLGMSFLDHFLVTISAANNAMRLMPLEQMVDAPLVGGKPENWWRRKFRFYRQQMALIDAFLATNTSPQLEQTRRYFQTELASLERQASRAAVPRQWRY